MNAIELERNGCCGFFLPALRKCCVVIEKNVDLQTFQNFYLLRNDSETSNNNNKESND